MRFTTLALIDVACAVMAVVVGISAAWLGLRYWSLVLMQAANSATILVLCWALSDWRPARPRGLSEVGGLLRFGGHLTGSNLVNYAATNLDSVLIGRVAGSVALGLYDRAFKLVAAPIWQISMPVARVAVSLLSRTHDTPQRYRRAFLRMLQMLLLVTTPAVIWTAMTSATVVPLLLGAAWTSAAPIVSALAVATAFAPFSIGAGWLFISQNRAGEQLRYSFVKAGLAIASLLAGLPWGALGVAVSAALCAVFVHGSQLWGACRTGPVSRRDVAAACAPLLAGSLAAALGLRLFEHFVADAGLALGLELAGGAALSYGCFGLAMLVFGEGRRLLADAARLHRFTGAARPADSRS